MPPLLFLAFIIQSLAESAEQQEVPGFETVGGSALTKDIANGHTGTFNPKAVFEINYLRSTNILSDTDLAITKGNSPDSLTAGKTLTYTLIVSNVGPSDVSNVLVADTLPAVVTLVTMSVSQGSGCTETANPIGSLTGTSQTRT